MVLRYISGARLASRPTVRGEIKGSGQGQGYDWDAVKHFAVWWALVHSLEIGISDKSVYDWFKG